MALGRVAWTFFPFVQLRPTWNRATAVARGVCCGWRWRTGRRPPAGAMHPEGNHCSSNKMPPDRLTMSHGRPCRCRAVIKAAQASRSSPHATTAAAAAYQTHKTTRHCRGRCQRRLSAIPRIRHPAMIFFLFFLPANFIPAMNLPRMVRGGLRHYSKGLAGCAFGSSTLTSKCQKCESVVYSRWKKGFHLHQFLHFFFHTVQVQVLPVLPVFPSQSAFHAFRTPGTYALGLKAAYASKAGIVHCCRSSAVTCMQLVLATLLDTL